MTEKKRKKRIKLIEREKRLLAYPPNENTWVCENHFTPENEVRPMANGTDKCLFCGKSKPKDAKLLWPEYVELCAKVGIEPGMRWKMGLKGPLMRGKGESWKPAPEV